MDLKKALFYMALLFSCCLCRAQYIFSSTQQVLDRVEQLQLRNKGQELLPVLAVAIHSTHPPADLAYLYAYKSSWYLSQDSPLQGKRFLDLSLQHAAQSGRNTSRAIPYRAKAFLNTPLVH